VVLLLIVTTQQQQSLMQDQCPAVVDAKKQAACFHIYSPQLIFHSHLFNRRKISWQKTRSSSTLL